MDDGSDFFPLVEKKNIRFFSTSSIVLFLPWPVHTPCMSSAKTTTAATATEKPLANEILASNTQSNEKLSHKTPLDLEASASSLAAASVVSHRRQVLGVAAAELRALPAGRVSWA